MMKNAFGGALATGLLIACGPPQLYAIPDNPYSNADSAVSNSGPVTMVASGNRWYEAALAEVSTPVEVVVINRGQQELPIAPEDLTLVDEQGRVYHALPSQTVVTRLFGAAPPLPPYATPPTPYQPEAAPPPELNSPAKPPASPTTTDLQMPPTTTLNETLDPGIILVAGHGGGGGHGAVGHAAGGHFVGNGYAGHASNGWGGRYGYGYRGGPGRYGYQGRFGPWGWGAPYWGYGPWGWWFGPAYVLGLNEAPYDYYPYDPNEFDELGPWQVNEVALRPTELGPNERMGGLVFFEPAWDAKMLTLNLVTHPKDGPPVQMTARFEVGR